MRKFTVLAIAACAITTSAAAIEPGQWTTTSKLADLKMPDNVPASYVEMMKKQLSKGTTSSTCITQKDIDEAPERAFRDSKDSCRYSNFEMADGRIDATAQCRGPVGEMPMRMTGTYTDDTYQFRMVLGEDADNGPMTIVMDVSGHRTGECP